MYDFINLGKKGVNWASNLASYNHILNEEGKDKLGWKSPFEIYFGLKANILVKAMTALSRLQKKGLSAPF